MKIIIVSGIEPGPTGTGRFLSQIRKEQKENGAQDAMWVIRSSYFQSAKMALNKNEWMKAVWRGLRGLVAGTLFWLKWQSLRRWRNAPVILFHSQGLGFKRALELLRAHRGPISLFLLDSSFFCVRSLNYIPGELGACHRCIQGRFEAAQVNQCLPFPNQSPLAFEYVKELRQLVSKKNIRLLAQNKRQAMLAYWHFGEEASVYVTGVWTPEYDEMVLQAARPSFFTPPRSYDIVFHGEDLAAKGAGWALQLAHACPNLTFLFPFLSPIAPELHPPNCHFVPMTWDNGLQDYVQTSRAVLVPSLWSAPVEGALIKSLYFAPAVLAVENSSSFIGEVPAQLFATLPSDIERAAEAVQFILETKWRPDAQFLRHWFENEFSKQKLAYERIFKEVTRPKNSLRLPQQDDHVVSPAEGIKQPSDQVIDL